MTIAPMDTDIYGNPTGGAGWWGGTSAALGALGDLYTAYQNNQARQQQQKLYDIQANPAKMAAYINGLYQPMGAAVGDAVRRQVISPNWAAATGGATGGAFNQFIADALAKIEAERYLGAQRTALGALGGATSNVPAQQSTGMLGNILKNLSILRQIGGPRQGGLTDFGGGSPYMGESITGIPNMAGAGADYAAMNTFQPDMNVMGGVY